MSDHDAARSHAAYPYSRQDVEPEYIEWHGGVDAATWLADSIWTGPGSVSHDDE